MQTNSQTALVETPKVNWPQVAWFLLLAFGLSWLLDLVLYLKGGLAFPGTSLVLQFQMLLPAFSAILLGVFFFKNSPIYYRSNRTASRWFCYFYLLMTLAYLVGAVFCLLQPAQTATLSSLLLIFSVVGLILLVVLRWIGGKNTYSSVGMGGGRARIWLVCGLGLVAFFGLMTFLNYVFKLGTVIDLKTAFPQLAAYSMPVPALLSLLAVQTIVIGPFLGLIITFGEEYGWRGYLQSELNRLGRIRGTFILGVIWGIWHWPLIWMGYNYPGHPYLGSLMMVVVCLVLAYFLAYGLFKSKGVWTAAFLHALNNQAINFFVLFMVKPTDNLLSFEMGLPGLVIAAVIILLLLRDPVWREDGQVNKVEERLGGILGEPRI